MIGSLSLHCSRPALLSQLKRLAALCCSVLGAPGCDPLTQTAAARVLSLLADSSKWSSCLAVAAAAAEEQGGGNAAAWAAGAGGGAASDAAAAMQCLQERWLCFLAAAPMVVQAVRRLAVLAEQAGVGSTDAGKSQQQQQQPQQQSQQQVSLVPAAQVTAMMNGLILMQLRLQQQLLGGATGSPAASPPAAGAAAAVGAAATVGTATAAAAARESALSLLVAQVLTIPNLLPKLSPAATSLLTQPSTFAAALDCAAAAAGSVKSGRAAAAGTAAGLHPGKALWLLANLTGLLAGKKVRQGDAVPAADSAASGQADGGKAAAVEFLPPSPLLRPWEAGCKGGGVALPFAVAADALLRCAAGSGGCCGAEEADALQALWPFSEGSFAAQLLGALPMEIFAHLFHSLLSLLDAAGVASRARRHSKSSGGGGGGGGAKGAMGSARVLSALAFATPLLPQLWKWLGVAVGVPLEAPLQVGTVACGRAQPLGLPCFIPALHKQLGSHA